MKKGMEYQGVVEKIDFPNKGTVDCGEEGVALVKRTIPGQKVSFVVSKKRSGKCVGRLKEVLEKSPLENAEPLCPHFAECGGCSYQTMDYENQTNLKKEMVKNILDGVITNKDYEFEGILRVSFYDKILHFFLQNVLIHKSKFCCNLYLQFYNPLP